MEVIHNYSLKYKNTFHINAVVENFYIPVSVDELKELISDLNDKREKFYILSGGSNILINDKKIYKHIIYMSEIDKSMIKQEDNTFYIGASNKIQDVINFVNNYEYGGIEELYGIPALFGGIIYMNAGIGSKKSPLFNISDYIIGVYVLQISTGRLKFLDKAACNFNYRKSIFQNEEYVILGAKIFLPKQTKVKSQEKIRKRLEVCRNKHDWGKGCFGSCFCVYTKKILRVLQFFNITKNMNLYQSKQNPNWLVNNGNATFEEVNKFINCCILIHKILHRNIECEVRIWK